MKRDAESNRLLLGVIGGAALILMTILGAMFVVTRRPVVVITPGKSVATSPGAAQTSAESPAAPIETPLPELKVAKVAAVPDSNNPLDAAWEKVATIDIPIVPQQVSQPTLEKGTVSVLRVQAIRDDSRYAWRLSWDKAKPAENVEVGQFTDAVAIQFPLVDGAPYTMGGPGLPVRMLYWKAAWQRDVDGGYKGLAALHPNAHSDLYWFSEGKEPHAPDGSTDNPRAQQFVVASKANNPMADYHRKHPIEELTAHGFGSGTHVQDTISRGRGMWQNNQWYVVIDRPIQAGDPLVERFKSAPDKQMIAFAVWDGDNANRGGKKQISNWVKMKLDL
jgi:Ethylbenzene dehydrogenase